MKWDVKVNGKEREDESRWNTIKLTNCCYKELEVGWVLKEKKELGKKQNKSTTESRKRRSKGQIKSVKEKSLLVSVIWHQHSGETECRIRIRIRFLLDLRILGIAWLDTKGGQKVIEMQFRVVAGWVLFKGHEQIIDVLLNFDRTVSMLGLLLLLLRKLISLLWKLWNWMMWLCSNSWDLLQLKVYLMTWLR